MARHHARRSPLLANLPFVAVALVVLAGFTRIGLYHWRDGAGLIAIGLLLAALLRAVLQTEQVGLLALRSRPVDVLLYGGFGVLMLVVDLTIVGGPFG